MVETNTFGGQPITLGEFGLQDRAHEINQVAAELAREAAESFADGRHRWVIGSIGPGHQAADASATSPTTRWRRRWPTQARGLIAGGVDAILIETCQDPLQIKAAVNGAKIARAEAGTDTPIFVQVTVETTGTLLVGPDIAAAATVVHALDVPLLGLNCATGPQEMAEHVRWLAANWPGLLSVQPNAGPAGAGRRADPLPARRRADGGLDGALRRGGRAQPDRRLLRHLASPHIQALDAMLRRRGGFRPAPVAAQAGLGAGGRQPVRPDAAAAGEQLLLHRRALQRQRLQEVARAAGARRLGRLRRHGPRADRRGLQQPRHLHRLRRPRRDRRDDRGHHPLHRERERAAGDRQHRDAGDRGGAEAARRQADHQLDQLRGRREAPRATGWRSPRSSAPR